MGFVSIVLLRDDMVLNLKPCFSDEVLKAPSLVMTMCIIPFFHYFTTLYCVFRAGAVLSQWFGIVVNVHFFHMDTFFCRQGFSKSLQKTSDGTFYLINWPCGLFMLIHIFFAFSFFKCPAENISVCPHLKKYWKRSKVYFFIKASKLVIISSCFYEHPSIPTKKRKPACLLSQLSERIIKRDLVEKR